MKISIRQFSFGKKVALALSFASLLAATPLVQAAPSGAAEAPATTALPLDVKIEKIAGKDKAYIVKLTNTSKEAIKVTAKVLLAVAFHGEEKARHIPAHNIDAGKEWTIDDLAFDDHVIVTAAGHAPLEIKVK